MKSSTASLALPLLLLLLLLCQTCSHPHRTPGHQQLHHDHEYDIQAEGDPPYYHISRTLKQSPASAPGPSPSEEAIAVPVELPTGPFSPPGIGSGFIPAPESDTDCGSPSVKPGLSLATNFFFELLNSIDSRLPNSNDSIIIPDSGNLTVWRSVLTNVLALPTLWPQAITLAQEYLNLTLPNDPTKLQLPAISGISGASRRLLQSTSILYRIEVWFIAVRPETAQYGYTRANIEAQMEKLNSGFAGTRMEFFLRGVKWFKSTVWFDTVHNSDVDLQLKLQYREGGPEVLNIFVRKPSLAGAKPGEILNGVTQLPVVLCSEGVQLNSRLAYDAVTIFYQTLPGVKPTTYLGATTVHEVGHWTGLKHTFNDGNCNPDGGDESSDTAVEKMAYNRQPTFIPGSCDTTFDSCPASQDNDPIKNFMDYSPDTCRDHFTPQQISRMQWSYYSFRLKKQCSIPNGADVTETSPGQGSTGGTPTGTTGGTPTGSTGGGPRVDVSVVQSSLVLFLSVFWAFLCL